MGLRALFVSIVASLALGAPALAQPVRTQNVETELVSARSAIAPGETFTLVLRQKIRADWHTYWVNSGDSGEQTRLEWTLPAGFEAGPLLHPAPKVEVLGPIVTYIHEGEVLYPLAIRAPADVKPGTTAKLSVHATWLVCDEICVPEDGAFDLSIPVRPESADDARGSRLAEEAIAALPQSLTPLGFALGADGPIRIAFPRKTDTANPITDAVNAGRIRNAAYFPYSQSLIDHAAPQKVTFADGQVRIETAPSLSFNKDNVDGAGLLTAEIQANGAWTSRAFMFGNPPGDGPLPVAVAAIWAGEAPPPVSRSNAPAAPSGGMGLIAAIALALIGGVILNVMPCVFPVLSIKALSLADAARAGTAKRHGVIFFAGVMVTFLALAGGLIALKAAGASVGWGFQLQEPAMIAALALLFFAIGLNLIGAYEIGGGVQNVGSSLAGRSGDAGAFFTGALAVIAATPCTAPFMAGALGWAATQPPAAALAVFAALGAGFAAPFTALSFAPALHRRLPKPGAWMERARQVLAFPMFGAAVWLVWVLSVQTGSMGTVALLSLFLALGFLVWAWRQGMGWRIAGAVVLMAVTAIVWKPLTTVETGGRGEVAAGEEVWSPARVAELQAAGTPVFVNFTAAWCVTCKANEAVALSRPAVKQAFADNGVAYLKADWTARDSVIADALASHGRNGVPLYLYYAPGEATPVVLPQLLSENILLETVGRHGGDVRGELTP